MSGGLQPVSAEQALALVRQSLGFFAPSELSQAPISPALCAELLRVSLWSNWVLKCRPVYVTRLMNAAARPLIPLAALTEEGSESLHELLRSSLEDLGAIGDLVELPGGRWAPAPLRRVPMQAIDRYLILGGPPTGQLPAHIRALVERAGIARLVPAKAPPMPIMIDTLPEEEWLRLPNADLGEWTQRMLSAVGLDPAGDLEVEVYAPGAAPPGSEQYFRWRMGDSRMPDGRYLVRHRMRRGSNAHLIAELVRGRPIAVGPLRLGDGDLRRLMYGLDLIAGNPVRVRAERRQKQWSLKLRSALPQPEQRLLLTLGRELPRLDGKYYPQRWDIPIQYAQRVTDALIALGIQVDEN